VDPEKKSGEGDPARHQLIRGSANKALDGVADASCRLVITSPPYNIGKEYEKDRRRTIEAYVKWLEPVVDKICKKVSEDGHLCWQVGNYIRDGELFPLDYYFYPMIAKRGFKLRNRIIWHFNFGLHASKRFSGRYETLLWFTKTDEYFFHLDSVRVPQLYPGKRHSKKRGPRCGLPSGNANGKNPSDFWVFEPDDAMLRSKVWELPNVKANHPEKTVHPCQFPSELVERCVLALTEEGDTVLDPFVGAGTSVVAAAKHGRVGVGIDKSKKYIRIAEARLADQLAGAMVTRQMGLPVRRPKVGERVSTVPIEWKTAAE